MIKQAIAAVRWGRVGLFYGLAFGWVCLVAAGLYLTGQRNLGTGAALVTQLAVAVLYMPAPLVAAVIVERLDHTPVRLRTIVVGFWRTMGRAAVLALIVVVALLAVLIGLQWLVGNYLGRSAAGTMLFAAEDITANLLTLLPAQNAAQVATLAASTPPFWALIALIAVQAVLAGLTVNGLFALGEEYGWRGWLADELRPLGAFWANLLTGVLWGLWHAPLILMGFNYGGYGKLGVVFMVALCVPFSFLLWRSRQVTGSVLTPAVLHGAFNGFAGIFAIIVADANPLIAAPTGLIGAAGIAVVAAALWLATRGRVAAGA